VGRIPGGLAHANVVANMIVAGMSGSAVADAGGIGLVEIRAMTKQGFPLPFTAALTSAAATIGPIIPPSIPMVVYAAMTEQSVGKLFMGGVIPGVGMGIALMALVYFMAKKQDFPRSERFDLGEVWISFREAFLPLLTPLIIMGGILGGIFTPTEAAAVAAIYAAFLGFVVYKELTLKAFWQVVIESLQTTAIITFIIAAAAAFAWLIAIEGIPLMIARFISGVQMPVWVFLLIFNIFFLILGCLMEALSIMVITIPVLVPIMQALHLDPIHIGVVLVLNLMIGLVTPPVGMVLFLVSKLAGIKLESLYRVIWPFIVPLIVVLILITYIPDLVLWLPRVVFAK
jgi:tripartite ATP-independent transporter DctM subunit